MIKKVVVLYSNDGLSESYVSKKSTENVARSLKKLGYSVELLELNRSFIENIINIKPDFVFNCAHGTYGEDGSVSGILNTLGVPYTHSGVLSSSICFNKLFAHQLCIANSIRVPKTFMLQDDFLNADKKIDLKYPFMAKPCCEGSSIGAELITDFVHLQRYCLENKNKRWYQFGILLQEYIQGREIHSSIFEGKFLGIIEIKPKKSTFYDYYSKYTNGATEYIFPDDIKENLELDFENLSNQIYKLFWCRSIVRLEFILSKNEIYFLEINTNPGMTNLSICPMIANKHHGIDFTQLVYMILKASVIDQ